MASPFAVFRRNQKVMTVILTCLAMFAFIILGSLEQMDSAAIVPVLFGLFGAALAWLWGSQNERGISYLTIGIGAVLGVIAGTMILNQSANEGGISTAHGYLNARDLHEMKQKRETANQFVLSVFRSRKNEVPSWMANYYLNQFRFGDSSSRAVVSKLLLEREADELGIEISDGFITDYIKSVSDNSMTRETLTKIRSQLRLGESELYELLRSELRARVALRMLNPVLVHMPNQYWGDFEKLNVRHSIDAVAIPVEPFAAQMPQPSDKEIKEIFEAFKGVYPMGENPGFVQPDRLKLAWFESDYEVFNYVEEEFDYEAAEDLVGEIPEDELKARYEERKETEYKIELLPDFGAEFDDGVPKFGQPAAPVKITTPNAEGEPTDGEPADDSTKADDVEGTPPAKTDGDAPAETPKSDDASAAEEKATDETSSESETEECGDGEDQDAGVKAEDAKKDEQPDAATEEKPAADPKPVDEAKPTVEAAADPVDTPKDAIEDALAPDPSEVKYRSFEKVRDEIRELMLLEKMEERAEKQIAAAIVAVKDWRFKFREANPEEVKDAPNVDPESDEFKEYLAEVKNDHDEYNAELAAAIATKAEAYAEENGLKFVSPDEFLSYRELIDHVDYRIGNAQEPSDFMDQTQPQTAADRLFTGANALFIPEVAQSQSDGTRTRYAFWATGENEQHAPTLDEPGVREQVEKAVRLKNARAKTKARAEKLAEWLREKFAAESIVKMAEGVAGQSIFGEDAPAESKPEGDSSAEPEAAKDETEATDDSEKEESCGDEEESAPEETDSEESKPAAEETTSEEATDDEVSGDDLLSVIVSEPFTWFRQGLPNPYGQPTIEFNSIPGIDGVDDNFMKTVSETPVGGVVVIPNVTKQIYYVVYVKSRNPSGADEDPSLARNRQQFITENVPMSQIYSQMAGSQGSSVSQAWQAQFFTKHNVSIEELDAI